MQKCYSYDDYTVIIGDIIDSKNISNRKMVQRTFKETLDRINKKYSNNIASKFTITLGDEFQGLLKNKSDIINIISEIEMAMFPIRLRFGIGIGEINTDIDLENSSTIDGTAYHRARAGILLIQKNESQNKAANTNIIISSKNKNKEIDSLLNSILSVCYVLKSKWTKTQHEIIYAYLKNENKQSVAAQKINIAQSNISRALDRANFYSYQAAMDQVNEFLNNSAGDEND